MQIMEKHSCNRCLEGEVLDAWAFIIEKTGLGEVRLAKEVTWDLGSKVLDQQRKWDGRSFPNKGRWMCKGPGVKRGWWKREAERRPHPYLLSKPSSPITHCSNVTSSVRSFPPFHLHCKWIYPSHHYSIPFILPLALSSLYCNYLFIHLSPSLGWEFTEGRSSKVLSLSLSVCLSLSMYMYINIF